MDGGHVPTEQDDPGLGRAAPSGKPVLGDSSSPHSSRHPHLPVTQPPSPEFPGITFHIRKKEPRFPPGQHGHVPWRGGRRQCQLWLRTPTHEGDWGLGRKVWEIHVCEKEPEKRTGRRPFPVHLRSLVAWTSLRRSRRRKQGESDPR